MLSNPLTLTHSMLTLEVSNVSAIHQLHQHNLLLYSLFLQSKFIDDKCYFCHNTSIKYQTLLQATPGNLYGAAEEKSTDYRTLYI